MFRRDLIPLLLDHPLTVAGLARQLHASPREVADHLQHLLKSLERSEYRAVVAPAECQKCGFAFDQRKLMKPGKCPRCKSTWIQPPRLHVEKKEGRE